MNAARMSKIEIALTCFKQECFRFVESVEEEKRRFKVLQPLLDLLLVYQLLAYTLVNVLKGFQNDMISQGLGKAVSAGLLIAQRSSYDETYHIAVSAVALVFCILLPIQTLRGRWSLDAPLWQKFEGGMFMAAALAIWLAPTYYLALPKHLYGLFLQVQRTGLHHIGNMIMLPFYLVFVACSFLLNQGSLLTIFHLIIPVADMLGYHILLNNLMLVVSFLLSIWLLPRSRKSVAVGLAFILLNLWSTMELQLASYQLSEAVLGLLLGLLIFTACLIRPSSDLAKYPLKQAKLLEDLIDTYDKPSSDSKEFEAECIFIRHFGGCTDSESTGSFCGSCKFMGKPLLKLPKDSLCELLEQKISQDSKEPRWQIQLNTELRRFRFMHKKNRRLRLYRQYWKDNDMASHTPLQQQYSMYKTLRELRRVLRKEVYANLPILIKLERIRDEQQFSVLIRDQLVRLHRFWDQLEKHSDNLNIDRELQKIVVHNREIQHQYERLVTVQPLTSQHSRLYSMYRELLEDQSQQHNDEEILLASNSELQPVYILTDTECIVRASRKFQHLYHYSEEQLKGKPIANLLPKGLRSMHQQKLREWDGSEMLTPCLKLLQTSLGYIETFQFTLHTYPDLQKGLQYVGFIQPQQRSQHFLYNIKDDCFAGVSERLAEELSPLGYELNGIEERRYRCQQVFEGLDLKHILTLEQLKIQAQQRNFTRDVQHYVELKVQQQYRIGNSLHLALVKVMNNAEEKSKQPVTFVEDRIVSESMREKEKVLDVKNSTRKSSRLSQLTLLEGFVMLSIVIGYFAYRYGLSVSSLNSFQTTVDSTTGCLQTRYYFLQITLKCLQSYSVKMTPSTLASDVQQRLLDEYQLQRTNLMTSMDNIVLTRLSQAQHYELYRMLQAIIDNIAYWSVKTTQAQIMRIDFLTGTNFTTYINNQSPTRVWVEVGIGLLVVLVHITLSVLLSVRTEAIIPLLKAMYTQLEYIYIKRKNKRVERVLAYFVKTEGDCDADVSRDKGGIELEQQCVLQKQQPIKPSTDKLRNILKNVVVPLIMSMAFLGFAVYVCVNFNTVEKEMQTISRLQTATFTQSIIAVKLSLYTYLRFTEQPPGLASNALLAAQMTKLNTRSADKVSIRKEEQLPPDFSIPDEWIVSNQDICQYISRNLNSSDYEECKTIGQAIATFGQSKSLVRVEEYISSIIAAQNITSRYDDGVLQTTTRLCEFLSRYARKVYEHYLMRISQYVDYRRTRYLIIEIVVIVVVILGATAMYLDYRRKSGRVALLKQLFRMLPEQLLSGPINVKIYFREESLLEAIKRI